MPMVKIERPVLSEEERIQMRKIWELSELQRGDKVQKAILTVNQELSSPTMSPVLPLNHTSKEFAEKVMQILAYKRIPARIAWTIKLEEGKKTERPDIMLEAYLDGKWTLYDLNTAKIGLPKNWVIFSAAAYRCWMFAAGKIQKLCFQF